MIRFRALAWVGLALGTACSRSHPKTQSSGALLQFRESLISEGVADQAIRDTVVKMMQRGGVSDTSMISRLNLGEARRASWFSAQVAAYGWPKQSLGGAEAADAAFLIVQHAVHDTTSQAWMLVALTDAARTKDASPQNVALLTDRLIVRRGQL